MILNTPCLFRTAFFVWFVGALQRILLGGFPTVFTCEWMLDVQWRCHCTIVIMLLYEMMHF